MTVLYWGKVCNLREQDGMIAVVYFAKQQVIGADV